MAHGMTRRGIRGGCGGGKPRPALVRAQPTLLTQRPYALSPSRIFAFLDPIWTTAGITRNHGYMVYDTPFALDAKFKPQPQMVGHYSISPDKLLYRLHPARWAQISRRRAVRGTDCVVSLQRWMLRDSFGQSLATAVDEIETAVTKLHDTVEGAFPATARRARQGGRPPFIIAERLAKTDPYQQVTEGGGLGSVQICQGRVPTRPYGRLCQEHRLLPAQRAAELGFGRPSGQGRPRRMLYVPDATTRLRRSPAWKSIGVLDIDGHMAGWNFLACKFVRTRAHRSVTCW